MMQIQPTTRFTKIIEAVRLANLVLKDPQFYTRIRSLPDFTNTEVKPAEVAALMESSTLKPTVDVRRRWNPLSSVNAHVDGDAPTTIKVNRWKLGDGDAKRWATTLVHESVHCVDFSTDLEFTHNGNSPAGNEGSAPYRIQEVARKMLSGE